MKRNLIILFILIFPLLVYAKSDFTSNCQSLDNWEFLDMKGDGFFRIVKDESVPPGYGPNVIEMKGDNIILLAKDIQLSNGTLLVLWKDVNPQQNDADGILMFRAGFPDDLSHEHNVKNRRPQYWLEQDFDSGFSLRYRDEKTEDTHLAMAAGEGLTYDTTWNFTGWSWQKIKLEGENIYAKYWSATMPEPKEWHLHAKNSNRLNGRLGVRGWSAHARIAWFQASEDDIAVAPRKCYLYTQKNVVLDKTVPPISLFAFLQKTQANVEIHLSIKHKGILLHQDFHQMDLKAGLNRIDIISQTETSGQTYFDLPKILDNAIYEFEIQLQIPGGEIIGKDSRRIEFRSNTHFQEKIAWLSKQAEELSDQMKESQDNTSKTDRYHVTSQTIAAMLDLAKERIQLGNQNGAERAVEYASQMLETADLLPHGQQHAGEYSLRIGDVELSSQSFVMGQSYSITVPWIVSGQPIDRNYHFQYFLCDEYGKNVHCFTDVSSSPTSQWESGVHEQQVHFSIPTQLIPYNHEDTGNALPPLYSGLHFLAVTVTDPEKAKSNSSRPWTFIDNPEAIQFFNVGSKYILKPVHVSIEPVEISHINLPDIQVLQNKDIEIGLRNLSDTANDMSCAITIQAPSGKILFEAFDQVAIAAQDEQLMRFNWTPTWAGKFKVKIRVIKNGKTVTKATRSWNVQLPKDMTVNVVRENKVLVEDEFYTPINFKAGLPKNNRVNSCYISVWNKEKELFKQEFKIHKTELEIQKRIKVRPNWGYYFIRSQFNVGKSSFVYEQEIVATVVETRDKQIVVNGEPFIMKGVNVHGLWGNSKAITDHSMKIMKEYGFNTLRGDHPNVWLVDLAHENNLCWMVLGEFSCAKTSEIYSRFEKHPLSGIQETTRQFIHAYRDNAGALFWNSCNEIGEELDEFLITLYPCFKVYDPYMRPVNYANLYGQDNWRGQDIMGINYYFGLNQTAKDRQPIVQRSADVGFAKNLPVIYTEFNSFWGVHEQTGVEAVEDLGQFGLDNGMSGGTFYKLLDVPGKHPGLLDAHSRLQVREPMGEALKAYHADVTVGLLKREGTSVTLIIQNRRNFTLRNPVLNVMAAGIPLNLKPIKNIQPNTNQIVEISLPNELVERNVGLTGSITFETHFGLKNKVDIDVCL